MAVIKTKTKRQQYLEETLSEEAVADILDVKGFEMMRDWIDSETRKTNEGKGFSNYDDYIRAFRKRFKDRSSHLLYLGFMLAQCDPLRWDDLIEEILEEYLEEIVSARKKSDREMIAADVRSFVSMFVFFSKLPAHVGLAHEQSVYKARKKRSESLEDRNRKIREYAEWRLHGLTPLASKSRLYEDIKAHFNISLSDRQLRKILNN